ncbi:ATP-binding protein [Aquabacterium sp. A7-Y]|uniref:ATP-binding protein n=1 Tax=Aquabacterium sp. A7-Y TaxID=1349605 RepID=UPI00223D4802|nr:ATP-binding protein [Aquabacterium sp. A7-Y]MCW7536547.1 ATP-binding protein [Aquabacterium sp. A7-Y]
MTSPSRLQHDARAPRGGGRLAAWTLTVAAVGAAASLGLAQAAGGQPQAVLGLGLLLSAGGAAVLPLASLLRRRRRDAEAAREALQGAEQRHAEVLAELRQAQARLQEQAQIAQAAPAAVDEPAPGSTAADDALAVLDPQGRVQRWNAGAVRIWGQSPEAVLGRPFEDLFEQADRVQVHDAVAQALHEGSGPGGAEVRALSVQGDALWVLLSVSRAPDAAGPGPWLLVRGIDVTARRLADDALRHALRGAQTHNARLLGLSRASVEINRLIGHPELAQRIADDARHLIPAHLCLLSLRPAAPSAAPVHAMSLSSRHAGLRGGDPDALGQGLYAMVMQHASPLLLGSEELQRHPRWSTLAAALPGQPALRGWLAVPMFGRDGEPLGVLQLADRYEGEFDHEDLALAGQLAQVAAAAIESDALCARAQAVGRQALPPAAESGSVAAGQPAGGSEPAFPLDELATLASQELQEPVRKLQGFAERLRERQAGRLDDAGRQDLDRITQAAARLSRLLAGLQDYMRLAAAPTAFRSTDLYELARAVLADLEPALRRSGAEVSLQPMPVVSADAAQLQQLLRQLLDNALKFTHPGVPPRVSIAARTMVAPAWPGQAARAMVELEVRDEGPGFDPEHAERVFLPFQRLHGRSRYEGSGLGLAIAARVAERHGGSIEARPVPGQGACFVVRLPLQQGEVEALPVPAEAPGRPAAAGVAVQDAA